MSDTVREYLSEYEFRVDGGSLELTERDLVLLEDFGNGLLWFIQEREKSDTPASIPQEHSEGGSGEEG